MEASLQVAAAPRIEVVLPNLGAIRALVLDSVTSAHSRRAYGQALKLKPDDAFARDSLALVQKILAAHPGGVGLTKESFLELTKLADEQHRPEAGIFRTLAATTR